MSGAVVAIMSVSPGDPLVLLRRELNTRLLAAETALRLAGDIPEEQSTVTLDTLSIASCPDRLPFLRPLR